jgi:general nucleoside transport system ATP-binding protein
VMRAPSVLLVEQPTRGLDVGAIETVWAELLAQRAAGKGILLVSAELEEILNLADRIAVLFDGEIMGILPADAAAIETLGLMMAGRRHAGMAPEAIH